MCVCVCVCVCVCLPSSYTAAQMRRDVPEESAKKPSESPRPALMPLQAAAGPQQTLVKAMRSSRYWSKRYWSKRYWSRTILVKTMLVKTILVKNDSGQNDTGRSGPP